MRAVVFDKFGSPDVMHLQEVPMPEPEANQARIKVEACGVNFADTLMRRNLYPISKPLPFTPGFEFAGVIEKLGSGHQQQIRPVCRRPGRRAGDGRL